MREKRQDRERATAQGETKEEMWKQGREGGDVPLESADLPRTCRKEAGAARQAAGPGSDPWQHRTSVLEEAL